MTVLGWSAATWTYTIIIIIILAQCTQIQLKNVIIISGDLRPPLAQYKKCGDLRLTQIYFKWRFAPYTKYK